MAFNPNEHMMKLKGKDYLQVAWRLVWFREDHPDWSLNTTPLTIDADHAVFKAVIADEAGNPKSAGHGSESKRDFGDFIEKAETKAVGRALAMLGYGTQFAADELDEGERIVDSPVNRRSAADAQKAASKPANAAPKESQQTAKAAESGNSGDFSAATPAQIEYIKNNASDEDYMSIMQEFGANLEALSESDAKRVIAEIDRNNTDHPRCVKCGKVITGIALKNGTTMTADEIVKKSQETYNGTYCLDCMTALKKKKSGAA